MPKQRAQAWIHTTKWPGFVRRLSDTVKITEPDNLIASSSVLPNDNSVHDFQAIWDTGAFTTVISQNVVDILELPPVRLTTILTANG